MSIKCDNLIGHVFNHLTVVSIGRVENKTYYTCTCSCGNTHVALAANIKKGTTRSCGCHRSSVFRKDLQGKVFGHLTVLSRGSLTKNNKYLWKCQCDCGNTKDILGNSLTSNKTISCGCIGRTAAIETNKKYRISKGKNPNVSMLPERLALRLKVTDSGLKERILERDQYSCRMCSTKKSKFNIHHIVPIAKEESLALEETNLITKNKTRRILKMAKNTEIDLDNKVNFDFDLLAEIAENAPTAGGSNYTNYGRVFMDNLQASKWDNDIRQFIKRPYAGGELEKNSEGKTIETFEFQLHQEIAKKDGDTFIKTWYVQVKDNGVRAKDHTDWGDVIKPSTLKVFKTLGAFFKAISGKGTYCAIEDFATGRTRPNKNDADKPYDVTAPKFLQSFKNQAECDKAKEARFAKDALPEGAVPVKIVNQFKGFVSSLGDLETALENLDGEYEGYPIEDVVKASGLK